MGPYAPGSLSAPVCLIIMRETNKRDGYKRVTRLLEVTSKEVSYTDINIVKLLPQNRTFTSHHEIT